MEFKVTDAANAYNYGQIDINSASSYYKFPLENVYSYSWVMLTMNNQTYYLTPYDYVGETRLSKGHYTYKITYTLSDDRLSLELIED